ncbi:MAG: DNA repair protein RecN [Pseudomonadota bacterium]
MLRSLDIRDMLIIDRLTLEFQPGLNVLTGETGAGKSILLDALGFVLGWRGRAELVREGAVQGEVTAEFDLPSGHPVFDVLEDSGIPADETVILRRVNARDGRKTAWVNDRRVSGEVLRRLSDCLVELHGQHDDRGLLNARGHRVLLDAFGEHDDLLARCRAAWRDWQGARSALAEAEGQVTALKEEEDFLRHSVSEFAALAPEAGEDATLDARRRMMQAGERVREDVVRARAALGVDGAEGMLRDAARWLDAASEELGDALADAMSALDRALVELGEAEDGVAHVLDRLDFDPAELERVEERLFAIRALARKHSVQPDELASVADRFAERLAELDGGAANLSSLRAAVGTAAESYDVAADALGQARTEAAEALDVAMARELAPLKLERAVFATEISEADAGPEGRDQVAFTVVTNPGAPSGPLNKIASGGELSRFLLALKVALTAEAPGLTMIFDEIDRGVGGATADAVGRRLEALAEGAQVIVVTHSPQVAARGGHHWRVAKRVIDDQTLSDVAALTEGERVDELARMLAGDRITEEARAAARALLAA